VNKVFLDTNLIVYANDTRDARKQAQAIELITTAMITRRSQSSTLIR